MANNSNLLIALVVVGAVIIMALANYAWSLISQVKQQQKQIAQHNQRVKERRNAKISEHVDTLCMAGIGQQCDLSEIVIRVYNLMDHVQGCKRVDFATQFPASFELYQTVKDMAIGEARQQLEKQERMKQNLIRQKAEARLSDDIIKELGELKALVKPWQTQIPITIHS